MAERQRTKREYVKRLKNDYEFRTFVTSGLSFFCTALFAGYNAFLGLAYKTAWNLGIAVYYAVLIVARSWVYSAEYKYHRANLSEIQKEQKRKGLLLWQSVLLFLLDSALVAPIILMLLQKREIRYSETAAIAVAAYTVYKAVFGSVNYAKTRKFANTSVKILRNIYFKDALVSVLLLQYTLIVTFGNGMRGDMLTLSAVTGAAVWGFLLAISVLSLSQAVRAAKQPDTPCKEQM